jgi:F-type H+-transporting ATPase subunit delta
MTQTARLYGTSLYELAAEEQLTDTIMEQMGEIRRLFQENPDYVRLLSEPSIPKKERTDLIEQAFGVQAQRYLVNFLKLLCEKGILMEYAGCCEEFTRRYHMDHNIAEAVVTSAVALSDEQMAALKSKLEKISGKTVALVQKRDPAVLAGLRVELEGRQLDGTVQSRLSGISRKINEVVM